MLLGNIGEVVVEGNVVVECNVGEVVVEGNVTRTRSKPERCQLGTCGDSWVSWSMATLPMCGRGNYTEYAVHTHTHIHTHTQM